MTRSSSFILIATIAIASLFVEPAVGQFTLPKIKIPKVKKDVPATPTATSTTDQAISNPDRPSSDSTSRAQDSSVRGVPIPGARISFSNNPDGSNPKTSFSSSEYIYGHLDLGGKTVYDAFGLKNVKDAKFYSIHYHMNVLPAGKEAWEHDWHNGVNYTLITKEDAQKTYWNFDVLPDPARISTLIGAIDDDLSYFNSAGGMYSQWYDADSARSKFPQNGTYTIDIVLFGNSYDDWGKSTGESEKFPTASAKFAFQFSGTDGQTLVANSKKAKDSVEAAKNRQEMLHAMPDWWYKPATGVTDANLAPVRLVPMIKGFISQWNLTYMKHMIINFTGPTWVIEKNDLGIPEYRMVKPYIYVIYKDPKDNSCQVGALYMRESYSGAGTYGAPYLGGIRDVQYIDCSVIK
ncbi:MAG TPA: hypothetical protein VGO43_05115 [Pyrinomonadaceae bacterium]|jgi:hypothetical protein|nr:hypothetical protein [Pyrinomonadaceae bacterium]